MFFQNIKEFILKNKKSIIFLAFLILVLFPEFSFAEQVVKGAVGSTAPKTDSQILDILNAIITGGAVFIGVATQFAGMFLSPEWSSGSAIGFGEHLKALWVMVSNIVYMIFAFLLIWIALMNILGKGGDWELKQALPKFIGGVLIVPFTWLIVAGMLSISNILTMSILTIPYDTFGEELPTGLGLNKDIICQTYEINSKEKGAKPIQCKDGAKTSIKKMVEEDNGYFGILSIYTYNIMKFDKNGQLNLGDLTKGITSFSDLVAKGIFDLIFFLIFLILIIAITLALFVRGVRLWFFTILSPIFGLLFFFGSDKVGDLKKFSLQEFIALALVPVYVSAALSFGLLFIHVAGEGMKESCESGESSAVCVKEGDNISEMNFLGINFVYYGTLGDTGDNGEKGMTTFKGVFGELILKIFGLVFLWIAVMAALERSTLTQTVVAPIKSFGESVGKLAAAAPTYAPIIPAGKGKTMSAAGLGAFGQSMQSSIHSKFSGEGSKLASELLDTGGLQTAIDNLKNATINLKTESSRSQIKKFFIPALDKINDGSTSVQRRKEILKIIKDKKGLSDTDYDYLKNETNNANFNNLLFGKLDNNIKKVMGWTDINLFNKEIGSFEKAGSNSTPVAPVAPTQVVTSTHTATASAAVTTATTAVTTATAAGTGVATAAAKAADKAAKDAKAALAAAKAALDTALTGGNPASITTATNKANKAITAVAAANTAAKAVKKAVESAGSTSASADLTAANEAITAAKAANVAAAI